MWDVIPLVSPGPQSLCFCENSSQLLKKTVKKQFEYPDYALTEGRFIGFTPMKIKSGKLCGHYIRVNVFLGGCGGLGYIGGGRFSCWLVIGLFYWMWVLHV